MSRLAALARGCTAACTLLLAVLFTPAAVAAWQEPPQARMRPAATLVPPTQDAGWTTVDLPDLWRKSRPTRVPTATWYRINFSRAEADEGVPWAVFFPYL